MTEKTKKVIKAMYSLVKKSKSDWLKYNESKRGVFVRNEDECVATDSYFIIRFKAEGEFTEYVGKYINKDLTDINDGKNVYPVVIDRVCSRTDWLVSNHTAESLYNGLNSSADLVNDNAKIYINHLSHGEKSRFFYDAKKIMMMLKFLKKIGKLSDTTIYLSEWSKIMQITGSDVSIILMDARDPRDEKPSDANVIDCDTWENIADKFNNKIFSEYV